MMTDEEKTNLYDVEKARMYSLLQELHGKDLNCFQMAHHLLNEVVILKVNQRLMLAALQMITDKLSEPTLAKAVEPPLP